MIDVRNNFVDGLDLDSSLFNVSKSSYRDALNITRDAITTGDDNSIANVIGNQLRAYSLPPGINQVIGAFGYQLRNAIIYMVWNEYGKHSVLYYSKTNNTTSKIFENLTDSAFEDILEFTVTGKITSIAVFPRSNNEGDLLFFLDSQGRPTTMNIQRFIAGEYTPVTRDIIDVAKRVPLSPPSGVYNNDVTHTVNNTRNKLFKFAYRWVFDDFEKSTLSPWSAVPLPANVLDDEFTNVSTNNNQIIIALNSGPQNVAKIEILVSYVDRTNNWSDFASVETIDKADQSLTDNQDFSYFFYNDATYPTIAVADAILLYSYIPLSANAMCMPNGNVLMYSGITEGYDRTLEPNVTITIDTVEAGGGGSTGSLTGQVSKINELAFNWEYFLTFSGVPAVGTVVNVYLVTIVGSMQTLVGTYTTIAGDTEYEVRLGLQASMNAINIVQDVDLNADGSIDFEFLKLVFNFDSIEIVAPGGAAADNSIATWKWSTQRSIGLAYYDQQGRTNGVLYNTGVTFPEYAETVGGDALLPYINAKIYHVPPEWAYSYQWVVTKEPTQYLFFECIDVNTTESDYLYFDITNLPLNQRKNPTTAAVVSWSFQDGDRMRLIKRDTDDTVFDSTYDAAIEGIVVDPVINSVAQTGTFVKIKNVDPFDSVDYSSNFFILELYRPGQQAPTGENQVFFEFGQQYPILDPTTDTRRHGGNVTDQSQDYITPAEINIYSGDSYFRVRTVYISETGLGTFYCQDRNFVDFYISAVSSVDGRPLVIDINARQAYYAATWRHGQYYEANTSINQLNIFHPADTDDLDISYGDIMRTEVNDRRVWVFQKFKTGQLPIFSQINRQPNGTIVNVVTSQLINPVDYYAWDGGIGTASTSLVIKRYTAYFADNVNGQVLRLSQDGVTPLSVIYKINTWAIENLPLRVDGYFIYGSYDNRSGNYIMALEAVDDSPAQTLSFNEERNSFESFLSYKPEYMVSMGTVFASFKEGGLWTHDSETYNNFYTFQYESSVTFVFNEAALQKKTWQNITEVASSIWDCPEIYTNVNTYGTTPQSTNIGESEFMILEGNPGATIKRDANSTGGKINGNFMKGNYMVVKFRKQNASSLEYINTVSMYFKQSQLTPVK